MAGLIVKGALREEIESLTVHVTGLRAGKGVLSKFMDEYRKSVLRIINEQPTTTEAEIRAKAIDEFAEKLKKSFTFTNYFAGKCFNEHIDKLAEQLKEE